MAVSILGDYNANAVSLRRRRSLYDCRIKDFFGMNSVKIAPSFKPDWA